MGRESNNPHHAKREKTSPAATPKAATRSLIQNAPETALGNRRLPWLRQVAGQSCAHYRWRQRNRTRGGDSFRERGCGRGCPYFNEHRDARETKRLVENQGCRCLLIAGDIGRKKFCRAAVRQAKAGLGEIDILVNNAAEQHPQDSITKITEKQLEKIFRTNIFAMFFLSKAVIPHFKQGGVIINTASVAAYKGSPELLAYSATKGAIVAFTRSLSQALAERKIRVNAVAPGPIWTPLIPATFPAKEVATFGSDTPLGRAGEPEEVATSFVFLASDDSSYMTGQVLHPNGGRVVNG